MAPIAGQQKTCAGPRQKTFDLDVIETTGVDLGLGTTFAAWAYNGRIPGPTIEACQGDTVTINVHNKGTTSHAAGAEVHRWEGCRGGTAIEALLIPDVGHGWGNLDASRRTLDFLRQRLLAG